MTKHSSWKKSTKMVFYHVVMKCYSKRQLLGICGSTCSGMQLWGVQYVVIHIQDLLMGLNFHTVGCYYENKFFVHTNGGRGWRWLYLLQVITKTTVIFSFCLDILQYTQFWVYNLGICFFPAVIILCYSAVFVISWDNNSTNN